MHFLYNGTNHMCGSLKQICLGPLGVRALLPRVIWTGVGPKLLKVMAPKSPGDSANGGERRGEKGEEDERRGKDKKEEKKNERVKRVKLVGGQVGPRNSYEEHGLVELGF